MMCSNSRFVTVKLWLTLCRNSSSVLPAVEKISRYPALQEKTKRSAFMKNVFWGKFDQDFLIYPEVLNEDESADIEERVNKVRQALKAENGQKSSYEELVKSGILKLFSPPEFGGVEIKNTHLVKTCDSLSIQPTEALLLDLHKSLVIETLLKFGSSSQKEKYIRRLLNGEIQAAYAMSEESSGSDPSSIKTTATYNMDAKTYQIHGQKTWVTNGKNADIFIVFAQIENKFGEELNINDLVPFIVEKQDNITISDTSTCGLEESGICDVAFNQVSISEENMIGDGNNGYEIAAFSLQTHKYFITSCILGCLKQAFLEATNFIKRRKQFLKELKDSEHVLAKLGKVSMTLYALESMIYLIAGKNDQYHIDTSLESAIIQVFCYETALNSFKMCLELLGSLGYSSDNPHYKLFRDILGLTMSTKTVDIIKLYIALTGIEEAGANLGQEVKKMRNPLDFPGFVFKKILNNSRQRKDKPKLTDNFYMNVHPSLKEAAIQLEYSASKFSFAVENLLVTHGSQTVERQLDLIRVADTASKILAMTSVIGRASRSYCTGIRFCDDEILLARAFCQDCTIQIKKDTTDIIEGVVYSNDYARLSLGSNFIKNGGYYILHPTVKNIK